MPLLENVPAAAAPWGVGERVRGDEGRGGDLTTRAAAVVPREAGCLLHERSEAWRGARAAETHQLHVVLGEVVSPVLPADGELAGHAGGSSGVDAARSKLTSRRGSIRFFSSQEVPADRPRRKHRHHANPSQPPASPWHAFLIAWKASEARRNRARRGAPSHTPSRASSSSNLASRLVVRRVVSAPLRPPRARVSPAWRRLRPFFLGASRVLAPRLVPSKATTRSARPPRRPCPRLAGASSFALVRTTTWSVLSWTSCVSSSTASLP